jgi:hypothetical protein
VLYDYSDDSPTGLNKTFTVKKPYNGYAHIDVEEFIYEFGWHVESNGDGYNIPGVGGMDNPMMPGIASGMVIRGQSGGHYAVNDGFTLYLDSSSGSAKLFIGAFSYNSNEYQPVSIGLPGTDGTIKVSFKKTSKMSGTLKVYVNDVEKNVLFMPYSGDGYEDLAGLTDNQVTILGTDKRHFTSFKHSVKTYEEHIPIN